MFAAPDITPPGAPIETYLTLHLGEIHFEPLDTSIVVLALATALVAVNLQPWRLPETRTTLAWCVWMAHWFLIAGLWLVAIFPNRHVDCAATDRHATRATHPTRAA